MYVQLFLYDYKICLLNATEIKKQFFLCYNNTEMSENMKKIVVIGAGASGISAAIHASSDNVEVIVLEKNKSPLKKLLITGAGRCNYYNNNFNINKYNTDHFLVKKVVSMKDDYLNFFEKLGIYPFIDNGYYYPYSKNSISIQNALIMEAKNKDLSIIYDYEVKTIEPDNNKYKINNDIICDKIIIAVGSKAYPKTGSTGEMYDILKNMGVDINEVLPALVQLKSDNKICKKWPTIRINANISLCVNEEVVDSQSGELQLTDYGVSGICILNLSRMAIKSLSEDRSVDIRINLLPMIDDYNSFINLRSNCLTNRNIVELFEGIINYKLLIELFTVYKINHKLSYNELTETEKNKVKELLTNLKIKINGYNDYDKAQVCQGGVCIDELDENFMLKKYKNIYCVGEIVDIDGVCGGYNLAYAFISGMIAGSEAKND